MKVDLFRVRDRVFAAVASGGEAVLPESHRPRTPFKSLDPARGEVQPGLAVEECLDDIERFGLHVTDAHVRITEQAMGISRS